MPQSIKTRAVPVRVRTKAAGYDENVTPAVIDGGGVANGKFTVTRENGIELGLRARLRFDQNGLPTNTVNSNGDGTYFYDAGAAVNQSSQTPVWSFDWSVNVDHDNSSGLKLSDLTYELGLDADPGVGTNFYVFDNITPVSAEGTFYDHAIGDNNTPAGGGVSVGNYADYVDLLNNNTVAQNLWHYGWFIQDELSNFDPTVDGRYTLYLEAFDEGVSVARVEIDVLVGNAPSAVTVQSVGVTGTTPSASDNDFTRINNALQAATSGSRITLEGTFDWTEANALQSWEDADWGATVPDGVDDLTITAAQLGDATIKGPGMVDGNDAEWAFEAYGRNHNLEFSNLILEDFRISIGIHFRSGTGESAYNGTKITNNIIRMAEPTKAGLGTSGYHSMGIHYSFGDNQTISDNLIEIQGSVAGDDDFDPSLVAMQSNTSGGAYNGLVIENNTVRVLGAPAAEHPARIAGIWENGGARNSDIVVRNNVFENVHPDNDPLLNAQEGFRMHSLLNAGSTRTVLYENNISQGANIGFTFLPNRFGANFDGRDPVVFQNNTVVDAAVGVSLQSNGSGLFRNNDFSGALIGIQNDTAVQRVSDATCNWWGDASGPSMGGVGTGAGVDANVSFLPWQESIDDMQCAGSAPALVVAPADHDFGDVDWQSSVSTTVTLTNAGTPDTSLELTAVSLNGDVQYSITGNDNCDVGDVLDGGRSCTVEVTFAPAGVTGEFTATVDAESDGGNGSASLVGNSVLPEWVDTFDNGFDQDDWQFFALDPSPNGFQVRVPDSVDTDNGYLRINDANGVVVGGYLPKTFGDARVSALVNADGINGGGTDNQIDQGVLSHFNPVAMEGYVAYVEMELSTQKLIVLKFDEATWNNPSVVESATLWTDEDDDWDMGRTYVVELDVVQNGADATLVARAIDADSQAVLATLEATDSSPLAAGYTGLMAIANASGGANGTFDDASGVSSFAAATLSVDAVDFPAQQEGTVSAAQSVTLRNTGNAELADIAVSLDGDDVAQFNLDNACGATLAAGDSCTIDVSFAPDAEGAFAAEVRIASTASTSTDVVLLHGAGVSSDWSDSFDAGFDQPDWQFFALDVGQAPGGFVVREPDVVDTDDGYLRINDASGVAVGGYIPRTLGATRVSALVNADGTGNSGLDNQIDQGVLSHFNPDAFVGYVGYIKMELNYQALVLIKLSPSTWGNPLLSDSALLIDSGDANFDMGAKYTVELDVSSAGSNALVVARAFDESGELLATVQFEDSSPLPEGYAGLVGLANATGANATFDDAAASSDFTGISVSTSAIDFGQVSLVDDATETVTVTNTGTTDVNLDSIILSGDVAQFTLADSCSSPLAAGASCTFDVTFAPDSEGVFSGEVSIVSDASSSPDIVLLDGEGIVANATIELSDLIHTYDGTAKAATATTTPAGLAVDITYDGDANEPTDAGSYAVVATISEPGYGGTASGTLVINKATAQITLSDLNHVYDGTVKEATVTTVPADLVDDVIVTYNPANPVDIGSYAVEATLAGNANYADASANGTLTIVAATVSGFELVGDDSFTGIAGAPLDAPLPTVRVFDTAGNGVAGIGVTFAITAGNGSVQGNSSVLVATGNDGLAVVPEWVLGGIAGTDNNVMTASTSIAGLPTVEFTASSTQIATLGIAKTTDQEHATVGEVLSWIIEVENEGPSTVDAEILDALPSGIDNATWTCQAEDGASCGTASGTGDVQLTATIPADGRVTVLVSGTITPSVPTGEYLENVAVVEWESDGSAQVEDASASTNILPAYSGPCSIFCDGFEEPDSTEPLLPPTTDLAGAAHGGWTLKSTTTGKVEVALELLDDAGNPAAWVDVITLGDNQLLRLRQLDENGYQQAGSWHAFPVDSVIGYQWEHGMDGLVLRFVSNGSVDSITLRLPPGTSIPTHVRLVSAVSG